MTMTEKRSTHAKALRIDIDAVDYATFAESGTGIEATSTNGAFGSTIEPRRAAIG